MLQLHTWPPSSNPEQQLYVANGSVLAVGMNASWKMQSECQTTTSLHGLQPSVLREHLCSSNDNLGLLVPCMNHHELDKFPNIQIISSPP